MSGLLNVGFVSVLRWCCGWFRWCRLSRYSGSFAILLVVSAHFDREPFDPLVRYVVVVDRVESGAASDERFYVVDRNAVYDNLDAPKWPPHGSEAQARTRLAELGLTASEIDARITLARKRPMSTHILPPGTDPVAWRPAVFKNLPKFVPGRHLKK